MLINEGKNINGAVIKKIKLKKQINKYYFRIELVDEKGHVYVIDKPLLCDYINFRRQVFGIMTACGSYDLMRLSTANPIQKNVKGYYINGLQILENENKEWLRYDKEKRKYVCDIDKKGKKIIDLLISQNISNIDVTDGKIENIVSRSGVFSLLFKGESASTFYTTSHTQIFWGFGSPINIGNPEDIVGVTESSKVFTSFIVSLMNFYKTDDLLNIGGNIENYPNNPGYPGAFVKRSGLSSDIDLLLEIMKDVPDRKCYFRDCLTFYDGNNYYQFFGNSEGTLSYQKKGIEQKRSKSKLWHVYIPKNSTKTLAEMTDYERNNRNDGSTSATDEFINWYKNIYSKSKILIKK